jgi:hypothetical protein
MSSGISRDAWLRAVEDVGMPLVDDQDAISLQEFMAMLDPPLRLSAARSRINALIDAGKAIKTMKRIQDTAGRWQYVPAYKLVDPPSKPAKGRRGTRVR